MNFMFKNVLPSETNKNKYTSVSSEFSTRSKLGGNKLVKAAVEQTMTQTKGWVIGSLVEGKIQLSNSPKVHPTEEEVNQEIARLAVSNVGKTFVKLKIENFVTNGIRWI